MCPVKGTNLSAKRERSGELQHDYSIVALLLQLRCYFVNLYEFTNHFCFFTISYRRFPISPPGEEFGGVQKRPRRILPPVQKAQNQFLPPPFFLLRPSDGTVLYWSLEQCSKHEVVPATNKNKRSSVAKSLRQRTDVFMANSAKKFGKFFGFVKTPTTATVWDVRGRNDTRGCHSGVEKNQLLPPVQKRPRRILPPVQEQRPKPKTPPGEEKGNRR